MTIAEQVRNDLSSVAYWQSLNRRSLLRFFLLAELAKRPMHGYEIAGAVAVCCDPSAGSGLRPSTGSGLPPSGGSGLSWARPTDAMVYPMLHELEAGGYVRCDEEEAGGRRRKVCSLTERGREAYRAAAQAWAWALPQIEQAVRGAGVPTPCCSTVSLAFAKEGKTQ